MIRVSKNNAPTIRGNSVEEISRSLNSSIGQIWNKLNEVIDAINNLTEGTPGLETGKLGIRLVQDKENYYLEAKFKDGWARFGSTTDVINKKD